MGSLIVPVFCNGLCTGVESHTIFSKYMQITEEGFFVSGEREICSRNRNTYVDTNHTAIGQKLKFSCIISILSKDYGTICKRICIHQRKSFIKIFHSLNQRYRSEDLSVT